MQCSTCLKKSKILVSVILEKGTTVGVHCGICPDCFGDELNKHKSGTGNGPEKEDDSR